MRLLRDEVQGKLEEMHGRYHASLSSLEGAVRQNERLREENVLLHRRLADLEIR
jgi:hypothetical protein